MLKCQTFFKASVFCSWWVGVCVRGAASAPALVGLEKLLFLPLI